MSYLVLPVGKRRGGSRAATMPLAMKYARECVRATGTPAVVYRVVPASQRLKPAKKRRKKAKRAKPRKRKKARGRKKGRKR